MIMQKLPLFFKKRCFKKFRKIIKKETLPQVFSCELYEISKSTFFTEHLWATASDYGLFWLYMIDLHSQKIQFWECNVYWKWLIKLHF